MRPRSILSIAAVGLLLGIVSCSRNTVESSFANGRKLFYENQIEKARDQFLVAHANDPNSTEIICYLAEASRRLGKRDDALALAREALARDTCNAFAHTVLASVFEPMWTSGDSTSSDSCWQHANEAVECDPTDGNAWLVVWLEALRRSDREMEDEALAALIKNNFFSIPILEYNRWVLKNLPPDAILLTNGDLDTYPAVALQQVNGLRPDVAVVNLSLLNTHWYPVYLRARYGLPDPLPRDKEIRPYKEGDELVTAAMQRVDGWLKQQQDGTLTRRLVAGTTVFSSNLPVDLRNRLQFMGSYLEIGSTESQTASLQQLRTVFDDADLQAYSHQSASDVDRSPVRRVTSDFGAKNMCEVGLRLCTALHADKRNDEAMKYVRILKQFAQDSGVANQFSDQLEDLETKLRG